MPKLYFCDTGLACSLLSITKTEQLPLHPLKGSLFENYVIGELIKDRYNKNIPFDLYFWRDNTGNEMDVVIDKGTHLYPIEIKAGKTVTSDYFKNLQFWKKITGSEEGTVIYAGDMVQKRSNGVTIIPWNTLQELPH
jgi:predicted AAA+ superfamily ATPase